MKKWIVCLCALLFLTGCQNKASQKNNSVLQIGIVQLSQNQSFTDMREGFMDELRVLGYSEDELEFICQDAGGSTAALNSILRSFQDKEVDLIVPLVTSATQAAVNAEGDIPIIFISVTDPVQAGIMSALDRPDKNATGTCNEVPIEELFQLAEKLTPGIESVGVLYDPSLPNSVLTVEKAKNYFERAEIACVERAVTNSSEVQAAARALTDLTDVIYVPIDSTILSAMPQVVEVAAEAGKPVYGSAPSMVSSGALASVSVSEYETGRESARLADQFLRGKSIEEIPAVVVNNFLTLINRRMAEELKVEIPQDIAEGIEFVE